MLETGSRSMFSSAREVTGRPTPETDDKISEGIKKALEAHIVRIPPCAEGNRELIGSLGNAALGVADVQVNRGELSMDVPLLALQPGTKKVLIGPNGAGKSTILDALMERRNTAFELQHGRGAAVAGKSIHTRDMLQVARLDQEEIFAAIGERSARDVLTETARYFKRQFPVDDDWETPEGYDRNIANQGAVTRIDIMMSQVVGLFDMEGFFDRNVSGLSGGERTKLALFMVLLSEPDVILLDEPTNHLDLESIAKLTALFDQYTAAGAAILSVSHVDWFLSDVGTDGVLEIIRAGDQRALMNSQRPYATYAKDPNREQTPIITGDIAWRQEGYSYKEGEVIVESPPEFTIPHSPISRASFRPVRGGDFILLSGNNGSGKTKLIETMVKTSSENMPHKVSGQIAYLPQFWPEEVTRGTVGDFFTWIKAESNPFSKGSSVHPEGSPEKLFLKIAKDLAFGGSSRIGEGWLRRPLTTFSGGEQRLLWFLAVSALRDIDMLVLDEPTNHMDRFIQQKIARAIQDFPGAVVVATHDRNLIGALSVEAGSFQDRRRFPIHVILDRRGDTTVIQGSSESPIAYLERKMNAARQEAKNFKL